MKLVFATNNLHKLEEVRKILPPTYQVVSLEEIGCSDDIAETGETLEENSLIKAKYIYDKFGIDCFADDTGLEINALGGLPGVRTARWANDDQKAENNRQKALRELYGIRDRKARFRTVVTVILDGEITQVEGCVNGEIAESERGDGGFGYDPLFIPEGYTQTFAELPPEVKNQISHRARAMAALCDVLKNK